jgi:hypothetical protein
MMQDQYTDKSFQLVPALIECKDDSWVSVPQHKAEQPITELVADSSAQVWQDYCDARLRQFETWR